jgi:CHAT domain-containing protein
LQIAINGTIHSHRVNIKEKDLLALVVQWRLDLLQDKNFNFAVASKSLYRLFFQPLENLLESSGVRNLIFIQDGILRTVPMAALFDEPRKQYLIERYAITYSLGFSHLSEVVTNSHRFLFVGNSQVAEDSLEGISAEVRSLSRLVPKSSDVLLDGELSVKSLTSKLQGRPYSILHFALHNQIGATIQDSQLYFSQTPLSLAEFEGILRSAPHPLYLLTLASCDTALGDRFAVLGMAGLGLRSGTTNLLGSLWAVPDVSSRLGMEVLYSSLLKGDPLGVAVQKMQVAQIRSRSAENIHPSKWAGYLLLH